MGKNVFGIILGNGFMNPFGGGVWDFEKADFRGTPKLALEFSAVAEHKKEIVWGTMMRTFFAPLLGLGVAYLFFRDTFGGAHFASFVAVFATPIAVSSVPMAQEMKGDTTLAGQLVVWTTIMSALSVFVSSFLLRMAGVFG